MFYYLHVWHVYHTHASAQSDQRRPSDALELELKTAVSPCGCKESNSSLLKATEPSLQPPGSNVFKENWLFISQQVLSASSSSAGVELHEYLPFPCWDLVLLEAYMELLYSVTVTVSACVQLPLFYCSHLWCLRLFSPLLLQWFMSLGRNGCDVPVRTDHSTASCPLYLDQLWVSMLISIYCK